MSTPSKAFHIPSLDGLRTVAVMLVFVAHGLEQQKIRNVIPGSFGVTIFFFLSGYLITTLMRVESEKSGTVSLKHFYLRRAVRILPPFYLVLSAATLATLAGWLPNTIDPRAVLAQALHLTNYYIVKFGWWAGMAPGTWIFWSLAIEEHFYLVFPWIYLAVRRLPNRRHQAWLLLAGCVVVLAWRCVLVFGFDSPKDRTYAATDTRFDSILFGCALGLWGNPVLDPTTISEKAWKYKLLPLSLVGLVITFVVRAPWFLETIRYSLQGLCLFALYVTAVRYPTWFVMRPLNWGWMKWLGGLSYSLYLIHPALFEAIDTHLHLRAPAFFLTAFATCVGVSAGIYYGVELPMGRLRRKLQGGAR
jgi:peptidoglycan/LPS O-acetylase OafA/YrhL